MSKELILSIETSTAMCSVALSSGCEVLEYRSDSLRRHASLTSVFCKEVLSAAGISPRELSAVCISDGPGSYTGLRVGMSTAKGICFGAGVKLLSVSSLDVLAAMGASRLAYVASADSADGITAFAGNADVITTSAGNAEGPVKDIAAFADSADGITAFAGNAEGPVKDVAAFADNGSGRNVVFGANALDGISVIVPMIDARRMEVFCARYDATGLKRMSDVEAVVVDSNSFAEMASKAFFIGDGAMKCRETIGDGIFVDACPDASAMAALAHREYLAGNWRDVAYFEPFYLKEFVATVSKKKLF